MGSCRFAALIVLLLAFALLPDPAASARVLQGDKPSSSEGPSAPTAATAGSEKSVTLKESEQSSTAVQNPDTNKQHQETPPPTTAPKDSPPPPSDVAENKGQERGAVQASAQPVPPENTHKDSRPPGGRGPTGGTDQEGGSSGWKPTDQRKEEAEYCVGSVDTCLIKGGEVSACLQVSQNASIGPFVIVLNEGQNNITVNVKATPNIYIDETHLPLHVVKDMPGKVNVSYSNPNDGEITVTDGNGYCALHIRQPVSDWQQQFQQFAAYATRMNPIYGAYFFVFTVVLVGVLCACCKFARRRRDVGVPYQQLEMGAQAPNSSGADNTTSTADGWEDGWDDGWDDEEAPAKPSDKKPAGSASANGLSLRSQTNSKDGWDIDWDD